MSSAEGPAPEQDERDRHAAEAWFDEHGLPWFVAREHDRVAQLVTPKRMLRRGLVFFALAVALALVAGWGLGSPSTGAALGATAFGVLVLSHAATRLRTWVLARWAGVVAVHQVGLLVPLVTRALPLLLIFTVFFFINTEVWQVASSLPAGVLWQAVLLFAGLAAVFLLARLPEEVDRVVGEVDGDVLVRACRGTPLERRASSSARAVPADVPLTRLQRLNLLLVLLVVQASQVLLLAAAVFAFFALFGAVAIRPEIVESWVGQPPQPIGWAANPVSAELLKVAVFLAGFSGLYFTVYAVTDPTYREQFFTQVTTELEQAVCVHAVYAGLPPAGLPADPPG